MFNSDHAAYGYQAMSVFNFLLGLIPNEAQTRDFIVFASLKKTFICLMLLNREKSFMKAQVKNFTHISMKKVSFHP